LRAILDRIDDLGLELLAIRKNNDELATANVDAGDR
jgi:hypothetical protein